MDQVTPCGPRDDSFKQTATKVTKQFLGIEDLLVQDELVA